MNEYSVEKSDQIEGTRGLWTVSTVFRSQMDNGRRLPCSLEYS